MCHKYIGFYARPHSREKRLLVSYVRPSVRIYQHGSHWTDFGENLYWGLL
jgi:hypothetical protein